MLEDGKQLKINQTGKNLIMFKHLMQVVYIYGQLSK